MRMSEDKHQNDIISTFSRDVSQTINSHSQSNSHDQNAATIIKPTTTNRTSTTTINNQLTEIYFRLITMIFQFHHPQYLFALTCSGAIFSPSTSSKLFECLRMFFSSPNRIKRITCACLSSMTLDQNMSIFMRRHICVFKFRSQCNNFVLFFLSG